MIRCWAPFAVRRTPNGMTARHSAGANACLTLREVLQIFRFGYFSDANLVGCMEPFAGETWIVDRDALWGL